MKLTHVSSATDKQNNKGTVGDGVLYSVHPKIIKGI
jgi:hypothetical protein